MKDSESARRPLHRVSMTLAVMLGVLLACDSSTDRPNAPSGPVVIVFHHRQRTCVSGARAIGATHRDGSEIQSLH